MSANLGIDSLFRTLLPTSDKNYLPSCSGRGDTILTGMTVPDNDPSQPLKYWWVPAAASLPPSELVELNIWDGAGISPITMTAKRASLPNLPGNIAYPPYSVPLTNSTWIQTPGFPPNTFPSSWLSQMPDVLALQAMFPSSTLETGQQCYPNAVFNLDSRFPDWQPNVLVFPDGTKTFAGGLINSMYGPNPVNGGGRGNLGSFVNYGWVPLPHSAGVSLTTLGLPCLDIPAGYKIGQVENGITFITMLVPISGSNVTLTLSGDLPAGTYNVSSK